VARDKQDITEAELAVMHVLWGRGPVSIRQIVDDLHGGGGGEGGARVSPAQYATVQKQLERLEKKGFVKRDRTLFVHLFSAAIDRDEVIGRRLREMADKLCEGSLAPVLSHLAKSKSLTEEERRALRKLFEELYDGGGDRPKRNR
jgi:predicted transcriptional regulator